MGMGYFSSPMSGYYHQMAPMSGMASQFMSPTGMYMGGMGSMSSMSSMAGMQGEYTYSIFYIMAGTSFWFLFPNEKFDGLLVHEALRYCDKT